MIIGIPKEIKSHEFRVALTPAGVSQLSQAGHQVLIETQAGIGSHFDDLAYREAGATILCSADEIFERSKMILKIKEPLPEEYGRIQAKQIVFSYFHFAASRRLTKAMLESKCTAIAYETVQLPDKSLPLLTPMSEIAGRMAIQEGAKYLEKNQGGKGILLGGVPGVAPGHVVILGGGVSGIQAAKMAAGLGARVTLFDINLSRLRHLADILPANIITRMFDSIALKEVLPSADLVIGAVLIPGAKTPKLITKKMLCLMQPGTVLVDIAVDQGGCIETSHPTYHQKPTFEIDGIVHYCVANMPGAVPQTSTIALTNATFPYIKALANLGLMEALQQFPELRSGINMHLGQLTQADIGELFYLPYCSLEQAITPATL